MSKDNREELNKILKGYSPRNTHCNTVIQDHQRKLIVEEIMGILGEVTIDSGADVCEYKVDHVDGAIDISCRELTIYNKNIIDGWKVCPYCTKPITIKGE